MHPPVEDESFRKLVCPNKRYYLLRTWHIVIEEEGGGNAVRTSLSRRLRLAVANLMEVPKDAILDLPRITIIGGLQLYVENHKGIVEFTDHRLRLSLSQGELIILGKHLIVKSIFSKEILIEGEIDGIQYVH
jgi:sporulation protein YqfC